MKTKIQPKQPQSLKHVIGRISRIPLFAVSSIVTAICIIIFTFSIYNLSYVYSYDFEETAIFTPMMFEYMQSRVIVLRMGESTTTADIQHNQSDFKIHMDSFAHELNRLKQLATTPKVQRDYQAILKDYQSYAAYNQKRFDAAYVQKDTSWKEDNAFYVFTGRIENSLNGAINSANRDAENRLQTGILMMIIGGVLVVGSAVISIVISNRKLRQVLDSVDGTLFQLTEAAQAISAGDLHVTLETSSYTETSILSDAFRKIVDSLRLMKTDVNTLIHAALEGNLDTRADTSRHEGDYKDIIAGVNEMLDTVKEPMDVASEFIGRLADGEHQANIANTYKGYYGVLTENPNKVRSSAGILEKESAKLAQAGLDGNLEIRGDESKLKGVFAQIIRGVNQTFDAIKEPLDVTSAFIADIAAGTAEKPIENRYKGYYAKLVDNTNSVLDSLIVLLVESTKLAEAGAKGNLSVRSDISRVPGHYGDVVAGMNGLMDAISAPLNEAGHILKNVSEYNNLTQKMVGQYQGQFQELSESVNAVISKVVNIENIFVEIAEGDLSSLEKYKKIGRLSEFDKLTPSGTKMMQAIRDLIDEVNRLSSAAVRGDLSQRGEEERFQGGYRQIIEGINQTVVAIVEPISEASTVLQSLSEGDLTVTMTGEYQGEYDQIKQSINQAIHSFHSVLSDLQIAADQVSTGAKQVSDGSQSLSQGATEQAGTVEELTASITEIASQTRTNAESADQASQLSTEAQHEAVKGTEKMKELLDSIREINESSTSISKIIKVIDDIAFQTNILALNAAVEAARAGQYGKGFTVVAEEVRNLAAKSAAAAKDTTALIEDSIQKVEQGTNIANKTADMLSGISESAHKTSTLIAEIAKASNEQASSIAQIDTGIEQVSTVVQTNSATAEESAASSEELSGQAEALMQMVGRFKLNNTAATYGMQ